MNRIVRYFITYPIWANTLMVLVLVIGAISLHRMNTSFFPEAEVKTISVSIVYPGASPEEIEESLILKIENNLRGIAGIKRFTSRSRENAASVTIEVSDLYDTDEVYDDVKNAVDRLSPYPSGAERPVITVPDFRLRAVSVVMYGNADLWALKERAEQFRDDLLAIDGISQVSLSGLPAREIAVTVGEDDLRRYGMTISEITAAVKAANLDLSGGTVKTGTEDLLIRAYGRRDYVHEVRMIPLRTAAEGTVIRLGDVAGVTEQWEDSPDASYFNGQRAVTVNIDKTSEEDIIDVAAKTTAYTGVFQQKHPEVKVEVVSDRSVSLQQRIDLLVRNGMIGFVLVLLVLGMFLNGRLSFWVAVGIPISFGGMFIIAYLWGITINIFSLMGMIIVVGILVDDAIVVAEAVYQKHEQGLNATRASIEGVTEVFAPVFTAVATTILAFIPFFFFLGHMGSVIYQLALVVIGALVFSLVESVLILPAHLAHSKGLDPSADRTRIRVFFENMYRWLTDRVYGPALRWSLDNIWVILAVPVMYAFVTIGLMKGNIVEVSSFPYIDRDDLTLNLTMTTGTADRVTDSLLAGVEEKVWAANERMKKERKDGKDVILYIRRSIGSNGLGDAGGHAGYLDIELLPGEERDMAAFAVEGILRKAVGEVPGSQKFSFTAGRWGKPVSISLLSNDLRELDRAKRLLKDKLAEYPELADITDSDIEGWREIRLELKPAAYGAGLTLSDVAGQVRQGFFGSEVQRFQRGEDEVRVWVRYRDGDRASLGKLERMRIRGQDGGTYPLASVADYTISRGRVVINHLDGRREVKVEAAQVDPEKSVLTLITDIKARVVPQVRAQVRDVQISFEGRERHNRDFKKSVFGSFPLALIGIFVILILVFRSPWQAVIIFLMIPLGLMGSVWGHWFHGFHISRLSMFGLIALAGIVINDSIVFIDQINRNLKKGMKVKEAVYAAGMSRLRPILLTTVTTVAGMAPLINESSRQAQFLIPMAISLSYGLVFGSLFILFVVPTLFMVLNKFRYLYRRGFDGTATYESVEPAVRELAVEKEVVQ